VLDGLRADHLGCHGYGRDVSPHLDRLARTGVLFENAAAQATWTFPSFASILTSKQVWRHGVFHCDHRLSLGERTFPQALRQDGFHTAAFTAGTFLDPEFGLDSGFDLYRAGKNRSFKRFEDVVSMARRYLKARREDKFFLLLHDNDLHPPFEISDRLPEEVEHPFGRYNGPMDRVAPDYRFVRAYNRLPWHGAPPPPEDYLAFVERVRGSPEELRHLGDHYDAAILESDRLLQELWRTLEELGLLEDTVVMVLSDHGLEWGEKGLIATAFHAPLWETVLHVPWIVWSPAHAPRRVSEVVQLVDVGPTLLDLLGIPVPRDLDGVSQRPRMEGAALPERCAFGAGSTCDPREEIHGFSVRDSRWKVIHDNLRQETSLYDLRNDPGERSDVSRSETREASRLKDVLRGEVHVAVP
jgi:arylsulfatase A-like enzyme